MKTSLFLELRIIVPRLCYSGNMHCWRCVLNEVMILDFNVMVINRERYSYDTIGLHTFQNFPKSLLLITVFYLFAPDRRSSASCREPLTDGIVIHSQRPFDMVYDVFRIKESTWRHFIPHFIQFNIRKLYFLHATLGCIWNSRDEIRKIGFLTFLTL